jgi:hypothetical protein
VVRPGGVTGRVGDVRNAAEEDRGMWLRIYANPVLARDTKSNSVMRVMKRQGVRSW